MFNISFHLREWHNMQMCRDSTQSGLGYELMQSTTQPDTKYYTVPDCCISLELHLNIMVMVNDGTKY